MNWQDTLPVADPTTVAENAERMLIAELRPCIRSILFAADQPMATTAATRERGCRVPGHLVYRALVALERNAEAQRAGTAARSEVLWQLALSASELNSEFARLVAEPVNADRAAARVAQTSAARRNGGTRWTSRPECWSTQQPRR